MAGTKEGGIKARATNMAKHGATFYADIGRKGGKIHHPETRPFTLNPTLAQIAGRKGGQLSKRGKAKQGENKHGKEEIN